MKSEHTKNLTPEELAEIRKNVENMNEVELTVFRNSFDPDEMGFDGEEGAIDE